MNQGFEACAKARFWHQGQRYGDKDYFQHHLCDVARVYGYGYLDDDAGIAVAYLHDILEDTECTRWELEQCFTRDVVEAVVALTKLEDGETYPEYIKKVRNSPLALRVKLVDTLCNLKNSVFEGNKKRIYKYTTQLQLLTA